MNSAKDLGKLTLTSALRCHWLLALVILATAFPAMGQYVLSLDGKKVDVTLGEAQSVTLPGGQTVTVELTKKETGTFDSRFYSFQYKSEFLPNKRDLGQGINQVMMATAKGSLVMAQEYASIDPTPFVDVMIKALTKDEVSTGYEMEETTFTKKLADGKVLKGKVVTTTRHDDQWVRTVVAYGNGDQGVLFVTQKQKSKDLDPDSTDEQMLNLFWSSLKLKGL